MKKNSVVNKAALHAFVERMPKVDLHVHLEGSIAPETILLLAHRNKITLPFNTVEGLCSLCNYFRYHGYTEFRRIFTLIASCMKTAADFELIAYEFGKERAQQHILYSEVTFTIETSLILTQLSWQVILDALNKGRMRAQQDFGVKWVWIFDIIRDNSHQNMTFEIVKEARDKQVVALGLTGDESAVDAAHFISIFDQARDLNIFRTIHAGELAGPQSIKDALHLLHAQRIGHGVHAIEDPGLIKELRTEQIPLEVCITSNICLGIYPDYEHHPIKKLWDAGLFITINDDDPALFNSNLTHEYKLLVDNYGFDLEQLKRIGFNSITASFLPDEEKENLRQKFTQEFEQLEKIEQQ